jgi:hypothetical protein
VTCCSLEHHACADDAGQGGVDGCRELSSPVGQPPWTAAVSGVGCVMWCPAVVCVGGL